MSGHDAGFLARWSRLKHRSRGQGAAATGGAGGAASAADVPPPADVAPGTTGHRTRPAAAPAERAAAASPAAVPASVPPAASRSAASATTPEEALPPLESLTPESDFRPFMRAGTDAATRNAALKRLFADPQFNVMDGLDVYIDDYGKTEPVAPSLLARLIETHAPRLPGGQADDLPERLPGHGDRPAGATPDARVPEAPLDEDPQAREAPAARDPADQASGPASDPSPCS